MLSRGIVCHFEAIASIHNTTHEAGLGYEWVVINRFNHKQDFETLL